jgi:hypothetical protein
MSLDMSIDISSSELKPDLPEWDSWAVPHERSQAVSAMGGDSD